MASMLFSVLDRKAGFYTSPFASTNSSTATREFLEQFKQHPFRDDFDLFYIGSFDSDTGLIQGADKPQFIVAYSSLMNVEQ